VTPVGVKVVLVAARDQGVPLAVMSNVIARGTGVLRDGETGT
jgi:hypothetical protein